MSVTSVTCYQCVLGYQYDSNILVLYSYVICDPLEPVSTLPAALLSRVRPFNAETFHPTSVVPGLTGARATVRRLLFCVKFGGFGILSSSEAKQSFGGYIRVRT